MWLVTFISSVCLRVARLARRPDVAPLPFGRDIDYRDVMRLSVVTGLFLAAALVPTAAWAGDPKSDAPQTDTPNEAAPTTEAPASAPTSEAVDAPSDAPLLPPPPPGDAATLEASYAAKPTWEGARDLAEAEIAAGRPADAANHLAEALAMLPEDAGALAEGDLRARLGEAKRHAASIVVRAGTRGVTVELDGKTIGTVPDDVPLVKLVYAPPGEHTVVAKYDGQEVYSDTRQVAEGERALFDVRGERSADEKPVWPAIVIAGIGVAGVATGIGLLVASLGKESDADDLATTISSCDVDAPSGPCNALGSLVASRNDLLDGATVGFVIGGIGAVASVAYFLIPSGDDSALQDARLFVLPASGGAALGFGGRF